MAVLLERMLWPEGISWCDCGAGLNVRIMVATAGKEKLGSGGAVFIDNGSTRK